MYFPSFQVYSVRKSFVNQIVNPVTVDAVRIYPHVGSDGEVVIGTAVFMECEPDLPTA